MDFLHLFAHDRSGSIGITLVAIVYFGALTIYDWIRRKHVYLPGLLLVDFGLVNSLVRNLFFFELSPHPAQVGGLWRMATALIIVGGFVLFLRAWQQERAKMRVGRKTERT